MRDFICTISFTDTRIKPRVLTVEADTRKLARRRARQLIGAAKPDWAVAQVSAQAAQTSRLDPAKVDEAVATLTAAPKQRKAADPHKRAAALVADDFGPKGSAAWWTAYKAERALQRAELAQHVADAVEVALDDTHV